MNRRDFFRQALAKLTQAGKEVVKWETAPLSNALEAWDDTKWIEAGPLLNNGKVPKFLYTGRHSVVLVGNELEGSGETDRGNVLALEAVCTKCSTQVFWVPETGSFQCPACLTMFQKNGQSSDPDMLNLRAWPVRHREGKIFVAKDS